MAGLLQFSQEQMNALLRLEDAFTACEKLGLSFAGFRDATLEGQLDIRGFKGPHIACGVRDGYWVGMKIDDRC